MSRTFVSVGIWLAALSSHPDAALAAGLLGSASGSTAGGPTAGSRPAVPLVGATGPSSGTGGHAMPTTTSSSTSSSSSSSSLGGVNGNAGAGASAGASTPAAEDSVPTGAPGAGESRRIPGLAAARALPSLSTDAPKPPMDMGQRRAWLKAVLDETFAAPPLARAKIGVLILESDTGKTLYARSEKTLLNAASNVKLVTASAALALLGPEYRWKTTLSAVATSRATSAAAATSSELSGHLFLRGFGDPTLDTQDLTAMATDIAAAGIRSIKGSIIADETFFDGTHVGPAYDQRSDSTPSRAPSAGLSVNGNVVDVTIVPGAKAGAPARVLTEPPSGAFVISGRIVTASSGPTPCTVETKDGEGGKTEIVIAGRVRLGSEPRTYRRRIVSPPLVAAYTLKALLERRGIQVAQAPRLGVTPLQGMRILSTHDSAPLAVVVHDLNKRSNNLTAEQLLRTMGAEMGGRPGTWDKGLEAVARYLNAIGIRKGTYQMTNGSGLYDSNRFSPEQIATILRGAMRDFRIGAEFTASLAIAGTDGTIGHRMANTPAERFVRAKTGTLATASCLSGFAGAPGKPPLIFSILMNDVVGAADARRAQDRVAELLIRFIEAEAPVASAPSPTPPTAATTTTPVKP